MARLPPALPSTPPTSPGVPPGRSRVHVPLVASGRPELSTRSGARRLPARPHPPLRRPVMTQSAPLCGETGGERGTAPGKPAPRRPGTADGSGVTAHATSVPSHGPAGPATRVPMLESPFRSPVVTRRGAAASIKHASRDAPIPTGRRCRPARLVPNVPDPPGSPLAVLQSAIQRPPRVSIGRSPALSSIHAAARLPSEPSCGTAYQDPRTPHGLPHRRSPLAWHARAPAARRLTRPRPWRNWR